MRQSAGTGTGRQGHRGESKKGHIQRSGMQGIAELQVDTVELSS